MRLGMPKMNDEKEFKEFLKLLQFPEGKEKELQDYIITIMGKAEKEGVALSFDYLAKPTNSPNPCLSHDGTLYLDTEKLRLVFEEWKENVKYVKTEAAQLALEKYRILHDSAAHPLHDPPKNV